MPGIVEFGPVNPGRGIVPAEERAKAEESALLYGVAYLYDGRHLDPSKVEVIYPSDVPTKLVETFREYLEKRLEQSRG